MLTQTTALIALVFAAALYTAHYAISAIALLNNLQF